MINFYLTYQNPVHDKAITALYDGCPEEKRLLDVTHYKPADVSVVFGVEKSAYPFSKHRGEVIRRSKKYVVIETGYINRGDGDSHHYSVGFNGLNGRADFKNKNSPSDRWKKLNVELKPYRDGDYYLLIGQVPWDASVQHSDHKDWILAAFLRLKALTQRDVMFRQHPLGPYIDIPGALKSPEKLCDAMKDAHSVVTFNSTTGVESIIEGVTTYACDEGSMVWPVCNQGLDLKLLENPERKDRTQWANDLAYTQWTLDEMRNGDTWRHLF